MSAARPSGGLPWARDVARTREAAQPPPADISRLRARRREARRRRRLARVDLGLGVAGALVLLIATPGVAIAGLVAAVVLAVSAASFVVERRRRGLATRADPAGSARSAGRERRSER